MTVKQLKEFDNDLRELLKKHGIIKAPTLQPIETAPKDENIEIILMHVNSKGQIDTIDVGSWGCIEEDEQGRSYWGWRSNTWPFVEGWPFAEGEDPNYWTPLPKFPIWSE